MKVKARLYGNQNSCGKVKEFEVVENLPIEGEAIDSQDPDWVWGRAREAYLDPEQRCGDTWDNGDNYNFWVVPEYNKEDGTEASDHYFAIRTEIEEEEE